MVQAKKYSVALTEKGQLYVWGLKSGFGVPKLVRSKTEGFLEMVDVCICS